MMVLFIRVVMSNTFKLVETVPSASKQSASHASKRRTRKGFVAPTK